MEDDDEEQEAAGVQRPPTLSCKVFMKSSLYKELSFAHGYDTEEDEDW